MPASAPRITTRTGEISSNHRVSIHHDPHLRVWYVQHGDNPEARLALSEERLFELGPDGYTALINEWLDTACAHESCRADT